MSMPSQKAVERAALAAAFLFAACFSFAPEASAQPKWMQLPPTPVLPEPARSGHVERKDARLWYAVFGPTDGPAVLLLHGGGANADYWAHLARDLAGEYRVIVMDSRGHGRSTNETVTLSYEQMAEDAIAVLDRIGVKHAAVVGWSDGANLGFHLALRHPARVTALAAFAGNATPAGYQPATNPNIMAAYAARSKREYERLSPEPGRHAAIMRTLAAMWRTQPTLTPEDLAAIRTRTAILHAQHDEIIRLAHSREIAAKIPGAKFVLLPGVSHFALLQDPAGFNEAVRAFLSAR